MEDLVVIVFFFSLGVGSFMFGSASGRNTERHNWCKWYAKDSIEKFEACKDKPPYKDKINEPKKD